MSTGLEIAVAGLACRFPEAPDEDAFWRLLVEGRDGIRRFTADEALAWGVPATVARHVRFVGAHGIVDGQDLFDHARWGLTPREAEVRDPQARVLLELAQAALENAGIVPGHTSAGIGVMAGP